MVELGGSATQEACWHKLLGDPLVPVVAQNFPTLRRPESCPGLELPFGLLQEAAKSMITVYNGSYFLKGPRVYLKMVKKFQNTFYWHEVSDSMIPSCTATNSQEWGFKWENTAIIDYADLEAGRHIVCNGELICNNTNGR